MRAAAFLVTVLIGSVAAAQSTPPSKTPAPGCDSPESHQFDFWVGQWEVRPNGADKVIAHSLIEKRYHGCAIRENWMPVGQEVAGGGGSLSGYDKHLKRWRQTWYDSAGSRVQLDGGFADGVMAITGNWPDFAGLGTNALVTMKYQLQPTGEVRQWGESSTDAGKTWKPAFDFLYRRVGQFPPF